MRTVAILCGATLGLSLLTACAGRSHVDARLTYPPDRPPPPQAPLPQPGGLFRPGALGEPGLPPDAATPAGIYFLHESDAGVEQCVFVGERQTGGSTTPRPQDAQQARARAVLDMAEQARWLGGNVVVLPTFREDFRSGRLLGQVYRCGEPQRRALYERAAARQQLTVVPP